MARFVKRGKTWQYEISYKRDDGTFDKFRRGGFRTKKEAESAALEMELEVTRGYNPRKKDVLFSTYFSNWMQLYKKPIVSEITYRHYEYSLNIVKELFALRSIGDISPADYQKAINVFAETHVKETVKKLNSHIRACVRHAIDERIILTDFTGKVILSGKKNSKNKNEKYINYSDLKKILQMTPTDMSHYIILIACHTGARFSEILGLNWTDLDRMNKTLSINKTWLYKLSEPSYGPTKNHEVRTIAVSDEFIKLVDTIPIINERIIGIPVSSNAVNKSLRRLLTRLEISPLITLHGLRHSHASALIYNQVSILTVSERLGHKDLSVTQNTYAHIVQELQQADNQKIIACFST